MFSSRLRSLIPTTFKGTANVPHNASTVSELENHEPPVQKRSAAPQRRLTKTRRQVDRKVQSVEEESDAGVQAVSTLLVDNQRQSPPRRRLTKTRRGSYKHKKDTSEKIENPPDRGRKTHDEVDSYEENGKRIQELEARRSSGFEVTPDEEYHHTMPLYGSEAMLPILDFPESIVINILCLCHVKEILRCERTCKGMKDIVDSRQLWLSKLCELGADNAPDLPYHVSLNSLEAPQLRTLSIRALRGHENWRSKSGAKVTKELVVKTRFPKEKWASVLLPGGTHLVTYSFIGHFELWRVADTKRLNSFAIHEKEINILGVAGEIQIRSKGPEAILIVCYEESVDPIQFAMIIRINLADGDANKVFKKDIQSIAESIFVDIQGDFAIVSAEKCALLINWRTGGRLRLKEDSLGTRHQQCKVIKQFLICVFLTSPTGERVFHSITAIFLPDAFKIASAFEDQWPELTLSDLAQCSTRVELPDPNHEDVSVPMEFDSLSVFSTNWKFVDTSYVRTLMRPGQWDLGLLGNLYMHLRAVYNFSIAYDRRHRRIILRPLNSPELIITPTMHFDVLNDSIARNGRLIWVAQYERPRGPRQIPPEEVNEKEATERLEELVPCSTSDFVDQGQFDFYYRNGIRKPPLFSHVGLEFDWSTHRLEFFSGAIYSHERGNVHIRYYD